MNTPRISRLRGIALRGPGVPGAADFYQDAWGLTKVAEADGAVYLRGTGPEHHILSLHEAKVRGVAYVNFSAQDEPTLRALFPEKSAKQERRRTGVAAND